METTNASEIISPDRQALSLMTKLKLDHFQLRKRKFDEEFGEITKKNNDVAIPLLDKVLMLKECIERLFGASNKDRYLKNFDELFTITKANTSTSTNFLEDFHQRLMKVISGGKKCSEYNYLFGMIMSQWFSEQQNEYIPVDAKTTSQGLSTKNQLESIIFNRPELGLERWQDFLRNKLFAHFETDSKLLEAMKNFQSSTDEYAKRLLKEKVTSSDIRVAIQSLLDTTGLDGCRKRLLAKLKSDDNAVNEFASSLNLLIPDLADWHWPTAGVRGVFRRTIAGKYRCFYEEDFLTAIFLEHIGLKWSVHFKCELKLLFRALTRKSIDKCSSSSIAEKRIVLQNDEYWMALLPDKFNDVSMSSKYETPNHVNIRSKLFHLINVEIQLHRVLKPDTPFTVVSADLEWFGPSVSHEIVQILLEFCGVPKLWLDFFDRFLKQPVYYKPGEAVRQRQRGVPISYALSFLLSELMLFGMDLYVYINTDIFLYRLHDDIWFFNSDLHQIEKVWTLMNEYARMTGLKFNNEKCGSMQILPSASARTTPTSVSLPDKTIKWGLLTLESSGRFVIHQETLKPFLDEMKRRLTAPKSILEWVGLYNEYISFFMRNFGQCANILGKEHITHLIETFQFIHRYVFSETNGNALTVLRDRIVQAFPNCLSGEICEGWFYWPLKNGGLGMKNVYFTLNSIQQYLMLNNNTTFDQLPAKDIDVYATLVTEYKKLKKTRCFADIEKYIDDNQQLITFDEYVRGRETHIYHWYDVYKKMLSITPMSKPTLQNDNQSSMTISNYLFDKRPLKRQSDRTEDDDCYSSWLLCYYGDQIQSTFNQLDFIDSESIPISLVTLMKTTKIDWNEDFDEQVESEQ